MAKFNIGTLLFFSIILGFSYSLECSSQTVNFNQNLNSYTITSDPKDLTPKNCTYTFTVPKYFVPTIVFVATHLTGSNTIKTRQFTEYRGAKVVDITSTKGPPNFGITLSPVDFSIEINLPQKTADDTFNIVITVKDKTPAIRNTTFIVENTLGKLIDSFDIQGNSSLAQTFDAQNPQAFTYTMRLAVFTDSVLSSSIIDGVHVYDNGVFKGSLLDVYNAPNVPKICSGSKFEIVNTNSGTAGIFTIIVFQAHEWSESSISVSNAPEQSTTQTITATNGLTVVHEISNPVGGGTTIPNYYKNLVFGDNTELTIYAGCVTGSQEARRIATITTDTAHNFENLLIYGRCKTFVLTKGSVQWQASRMFPTSTFRHEIGRKGVIMSSSFPYPNMNNMTNNYLIQSPSENSNENIIVTYEIATMAPDVYFHIDQEIKASKDANKTLTSSDSTYTSVSTYQQYIIFKVPNNSNGFLIRYTVTSSANLVSFMGMVFVIVGYYLV